MLDKLDCFLMFNKAIFGKITFLFTNEAYAFLHVRKIFGTGLPFSEKAKLFITPLLRWKWEYGFLEMRLFSWVSSHTSLNLCI